jgi:hypothetical protein
LCELLQAELEIENAFLKKLRHTSQGAPVSEKYAFIEAENATVAGGHGPLAR